MTDNQLQAVASMVAGMQFAVVHLANVVADKTGITRDAMATSFEESANRLPDSVVNAPIVRHSMMVIADTIRNSTVGGDFQDLMKRLQP